MSNVSNQPSDLYYLIYQITNNINGRIYIGKHATDNIDDGYMGSDNLIRKALKKYGKENFTKQILFMLSSKETMDLKEAEIVTNDFVLVKSNYNLKPGGPGGILFPYADWTTEDMARRGRLGGLKSKGNVKNLQFWSKDNPPKNSLKNVQKISLCPVIKQKRRDTFRKIKHQTGEKNSQFGTCWIYNESETVKIKLQDL